MIIDNFFIEQFIDPTTAPGTPLTAITATINIWSVSNGTLTQVVTSASCTNLGNGFYGYVFSSMQPSTWYIYEIVPSATAYRTSNWVDYRMEKMDSNISDIRGGGGGASINIQGIQTTIRNSGEKVIEEVKKTLLETESKIKDEFIETNSHIELAKDDINSKIESIEIPEMKFEEKEAKKLSKIVAKLDEAVKGYIDERRQEKEEIGAITEEFTRLEMEEAKKEKEKQLEEKRKEEEEKRKEEEMDAKELELIQAEFDKQDEMEKEEKKKEIEDEIKEMEKEIEDKKKELKTL